MIFQTYAKYVIIKYWQKVATIWHKIAKVGKTDHTSLSRFLQRVFNTNEAWRHRGKEVEKRPPRLLIPRLDANLISILLKMLATSSNLENIWVKNFRPIFVDQYVVAFNFAI